MKAPGPTADADDGGQPQAEGEQLEQHDEEIDEHAEEQQQQQLEASPALSPAAPRVEEQPAPLPSPPPSALDDDPPFSPEEIEAYVRDGFVLLKRAFPPSVAASCREALWRVMEEQQGIRRDDPGTWPVKCPLAFIFEEGHGQVRVLRREKASFH